MKPDQDDKAIRRMNFLFWGSMVLQAVALVAIFVGLIARGSKHDWGIWFTITGWSGFASGFVVRFWIRSWFYKRGQ